MLSQYPVLLSLVLGIAVLCGAFYIYRQERRLESISRSGLTMEKTESARPWSRQFLINENDLESGPQVEDEDNTDSFHYEPPMIVGDSSLPIVPPLVFEDARLALQPEGPGLALSPPRSSPVDLPAQPSAALLPNSHARRGSDTVALTCGTPGVRGVAYLHGSDGVETARSSMVLTSSILPPSYHSNYPVPVNPQSGPVRELHQRPGSSSREDEGVEESGTGTSRRRSFDGGVRLTGGRPGEGDSEAFGAEEVSGMPPTYHDL